MQKLPSGVSYADLPYAKQKQIMDQWRLEQGLQPGEAIPERFTPEMEIRRTQLLQDYADSKRLQTLF